MKLMPPYLFYFILELAEKIKEERLKSD